MLVRLRPAWEELRSYLTAKGRKRFEEREYALEMWRLLDPDAELINTKEMTDRVVCVKSGNLGSSLFIHFHLCLFVLLFFLNSKVMHGV